MNEKQEAVRELLLKMRSAQQGTTSISKSMVLIFLDLVDMYEQIMASQIDYTIASSNVLPAHHGDRAVASMTILQLRRRAGPYRHRRSAGQRSMPKVNLKLELEKQTHAFKTYQATLPTLKERASLLFISKAIIDNSATDLSSVFIICIASTRLKRAKRKLSFDHQPGAFQIHHPPTRTTLQLSAITSLSIHISSVMLSAPRLGSMVTGLPVRSTHWMVGKTYWILRLRSW